ncbi:MAG: 4Fe-4S dicluster domain-containing protein [candidate division KSB1 bacterium]|nr:4Fe-4S dicluster domain-containing protein [candidate division KSB1 bacterium]MDZ7369269.1 4Fe-4S dicluster domain-containing protein [candidate division KSB1 bacterium]MDZ7407304.1 4Fe-4S dicluster domain-containing protein [candidate division KSB1 bacterium]
MQIKDKIKLRHESIQPLFELLSKSGYRLIGPAVRDGAIVYEELHSVADLPVGWTDEQNPGVYRLKKRQDQALFGYTVGPHSWKKFLHRPLLRLWKARRRKDGWEIFEAREPPAKLAFIGVRACELRAIAIQDKIFLEGQYVDPAYQAQRENIFIVAVNCGQAGGTCFCADMNAGPQAISGFDLALTEVIAPGQHYFIAEIGSARGAGVLSQLPCEMAQENEKRIAENIVTNTAAQMRRRLNTTGIKDLLYRNTEHPRWDEVAGRCLNCANCTMVCPTCFCTTVEDVTDLTGENAERWRKWDSCFTMDFSYIHGGSVRPSAKARYRQWLTHKLASWIDQFGTSGCVGCGRCITWCPVGIDITEEVRAIHETPEADDRR